MANNKLKALGEQIAFNTRYTKNTLFLIGAGASSDTANPNFWDKYLFPGKKDKISDPFTGTPSLRTIVYNMLYCHSKENQTVIKEVISSINEYEDWWLQNGQTYYYAVTSVDTDGNESVYSNVLNTSPQAGFAPAISALRKQYFN